MTIKITFLLFSLFCFSSIFAQQENITSKELNDVLITANRTKIYPDANRIITVIDRKEIEQLPVQNLDELLDRIAGFDVRQRGTGNVQADINVRGGSFDQVLILLNGVNITDPQTGHYNLDIPIELGDINRIEILQGSAARIYGTNAFSGAINIITNSSSKNYVKSNNEAGSFGTINEGISGNHFSDSFQTFASISYKQSDGYIKNTDYKIINSFWQTKIDIPGSGYFQFQLGADIKNFGANSFYTPKLPNQFENTKTFLSSLEWNYEKRFYTLNTQVYWREHFDKFTFNRYAPTITANYHKTDITGGKISTNFNRGKYGKTTIGIDLRNEHIFSNNIGETMETPVRVPFEKDSVYYTKHDNRLLIMSMIDHNISINHWNIAGGISSTSNKQFRTQLNGGVDASYKINDYWKIFTALNTAIRLPTFTDLYYSDPIRTGNPNLKPEKSTTLELGEKTTVKKFMANAVIYYRWGKNIIDWVKTSVDDTKYHAENLTNINAFGSDINAEYKSNCSFLKSINITYSHVNLLKKANVYDSQYALDYLKNKVTISLYHGIWKNLSADWDIAWFDRAGTYIIYSTQQVTEYKPYALLNGKLMWNSKKIDLYFQVNNILNKPYVDFGGLEQPKINFNGGIILKI